ncbi:PLP-dependent aminotransferase family protein [Minwuia thermotolerans]|uniref:PLP-dependent aminotransferase family protein n=2 Tax=Minwuia thermotolerans TaxID=2056226 RepID=A0A2M9G4Y8_9PROT|nr:PLP-dependent aminotransferase family protein [Minwuia thermotolerans]
MANSEEFEQSNMSDALLAALTLDRTLPAPLAAQVYDALRALIADGRLKPGAALPASRPFAAELGVSRATVVAAYDQLVAEGYAEGRRGSGVYVGDIGVVPAPAAATAPSERRRPQAARSRPVAFDPGVPDMRAFPYRAWGRTVARTARATPEALVQETEAFGDPDLRTEIARHLAEWRGVEARPEQIIVTAGAGDALEIAIRTLAGPGDTVGLEDPGYLPLREFVLGLGLRPLWLDVDAEGAAPPPAADPPRLGILTPSHQFPLGGAMPTSRRFAFLNFAEATGAWLVEDDFDSEFRYAGRPIPALASLDRGGRVIYVGSLSKVFSMGLRLGYMVAPEALLPAFRDTLERRSRPKASAALQRPLAAFMAEGEFHRHIRRMRRIYAERYRAFLGLLAASVGGRFAWEESQAGMQIALRLEEGADDAALSRLAAEAGVRCPPLSRYRARPGGPRGLLLGFCACEPAEMAGGFARLEQVLTRWDG